MVRIDIDPPSPVAGEPVTFTAEDVPPSADTFVWSGSGAIEGFARSTTVTYQVPGTFDVAVTITGPGGQLARPTTTVTVEEEAEPPPEPEPDPEPEPEPKPEPDPEPAPEGPSITVPEIVTNSRTFSFFGGSIQFTAVTEVGVNTREIGIPAPSEFQVFQALQDRVDALTDSVDAVEDDLSFLEQTVGELQDAIQGIDLQDIRRRLSGVEADLRGAISGLRDFAERQAAQVRDDLEREVTELEAALTSTLAEAKAFTREIRASLQAEIQGVLTAAQQAVDSALSELRADLVPEALDGQQLSQRILTEVEAVLSDRFRSLAEAFGFLADLDESTALKDFIDNPPQYVLNAVLSEAERQLDENLLPRLKTLTDRALDVALEPGTKQRLRDRTDE